MSDGRDPHPQRPESAIVRRVRGVSLWSVCLAVVVVALIFGLESWVILVAGFALIFAAVNRAASKRIEELLERKPAVTLAVGGHDDLATPIAAAALAPWPIDVERIVAYETGRLAEDADVREEQARKPNPLHALQASSLLMRPGEQAFARACERFDEALAYYENELVEWLAEYRSAADQRARTLELRISVLSDRRGAYAERVTLALDLPAGMELVDEWPTLSPPPEPPSYTAPQPLSVLEPRLGPGGIAFPRTTVRAIDLAPPSIWQQVDGGRRIETQIGDVHHGRRVELDEPLLLRASAVGRHELGWTLFIKNARRPVAGSLSLLVHDGDSGRPPFRRLNGVERYPDVPFVDEDGDEVHPARTTDPPTSPPQASADTDALAGLRARAQERDWAALGLHDS